MTVLDIYRHALHLGLRLEPREGDRLAVTPAAKAPPDFVEVLRQHKAELLALLEAQAANLTPDCAPWLHVARQVLEGEFDGANRSTMESIRFGLCGVDHPRARQALRHLSAVPSSS